MRYLLVNHIAAVPGRDAAHVSVPASWARDLAAAGRAAIASHVHLMVATPLEHKPRAAGRRVDLQPAASGLEHLAIPGYRSARTFLSQRAALRTALGAVIATADVVQLDHGGYPVPLGIVAGREAAAAGKTSVWTLGDATLPVSRLGASAQSRTKRLLGRQVDPRVGHGLFAAIREATHVVATHQSAAKQLRSEYRINAIWIDAFDLIDAELADARTVSLRHARLLDGNRPLRLVAAGPHTIARGTAAIVRAIHHAWRLRVPVELTIAGDGGELPALHALVGELGLTKVIRFTLDVDTALRDADVVIDWSTSDSREASTYRAMANGIVPIVGAAARIDAPLRRVEGDAAQALAGLIVDAAVRRSALAATMLAGVEWCRARTIESSYRRRFALVAERGRRKSKRAA